ncbi:ABC transporter integral membrane domain protein, partial [Chlamydia psittaci C1/97]
STLVKRG